MQVKSKALLHSSSISAKLEIVSMLIPHWGLKTVHSALSAFSDTGDLMIMHKRSGLDCTSPIMTAALNVLPAYFI